MAARENQGYLIAVIVLVLLALILALVAFLGIQKAYEQAELAQASDAKHKATLLLAKAEGLKAEALKAIIGDLGTAPSELGKTINDLQQISGNSALSDAEKKLVDDIIAEVRTAQEVYRVETQAPISGDEDATLATLRSRIADLTSLVDRMRKDYTIQVRQTDEAARDAKSKIAQAEETLASTIKEMENLNEKLIAEKAASLQKENILKEEVNQSKQAIAAVTRRSEEAAQQAAALLREAKNQVALLESDNVNLKTQLNQFTNEVFDRADGQIVRVASPTDTVYVNIGRAHGLTNNSTFSVYDQSVTDFESATPKGRIEVIRVENFQAVARIADENIVDPISRGDHILTPTWDPGFTVKLALAGRFDMDGDGHDDTNRLIQLIRRNGGEVVASHDAEGNLKGEISPEVRFLVLSTDALISTDDDPNAGRILSAVQSMEAAAIKNTVQVIDLQKLLNRMGVRAQPKTKQIDFPNGGFVPRQPSGSSSRPSGSSTKPAGSSTRPAGSSTKPAGSSTR